MRKVQYTAKSGKTQWMPVGGKAFERECYEGTTGFCLACGNTQSGVEPDARKYECESCKALKVYGLEELLLMNLVSNKSEKEAS